MEKDGINNPKINDIFGVFLPEIKMQESYYLLEKMFEQNLIDSSIAKEISTLYFVHYKTMEEIESNFNYFIFQNSNYTCF